MVSKHGEFIWYELCTGDADGAQAFYSAVIGWHIAGSLTPGMDYRIVHATDDENGERVPVGALAQLSDEMKACGAQPVWLGYIAVDDVDASVNRIVAAGGAVSMPATDIADVGRIALVTDPQGAPFYLMRGIHDVPSAAFAADRPRVGHCAWNELASAVLRPLFMARRPQREKTHEIFVSGLLRRKKMQQLSQDEWDALNRECIAVSRACRPAGIFLKGHRCCRPTRQPPYEFATVAP